MAHSTNTSATGITRTCNASPTYSEKWTWSGWVKRSSTGGTTALFGNYKTGSNTVSLFNLYWGGGDKLHWECVDSTAGKDSEFVTNMVFRDVNAWYHIMLVYDTDNGTENDRLILYVNGLNVRDNGGFATDNKKEILAQSKSLLDG